MEDALLYVGASAAVYTGIILVLVIGLMIASRKLVPSGEIKIDVNEGTKDLIADPGETLLSALAANKIYLPSACGGAGTCALCKCKVLAGGGTILPTETGHISKKEAKQGYRLACQLKTKQDLKIWIPPEIMEIRKFEGTVVSNQNVATFIKEFVVEIPEDVHLDFQAGGYIQIDIPPFDVAFADLDIGFLFYGVWEKMSLFDLHTENADPCFRAYSMANFPGEGNLIKLNVRIATPPPNMGVPPGIASSYIFSLKPGDKVVLSGPFGEFAIKDTDREMVYIGGGAGMAPLRSQIFDLFRTRQTQRKVSYWYGARSLRELFYLEDFRDVEREHENFSFHIALSDPLPDDEWEGLTGFIHKVVYEQYLKDHEDPGEIEYYLCGPPPMIAAVNEMLYDLGVEEDMIAYDEF